MICSSARPVRKHDAPQVNGILPALARPALTPTRFCSAMPTLISRSGKRRLNSLRFDEPTESLHDRDDPAVGFGERDQRLGEGDAAVGAASFARPSSSASAAASSSSVGTRWCHSTRSSMNDTPRPLFVRAMTQVGRPGSSGSSLEDRRSSASTSWPSTSTTPQPNARQRSASGSRAIGALGARRPAAAGCDRR